MADLNEHGAGTPPDGRDPPAPENCCLGVAWLRIEGGEVSRTRPWTALGVFPAGIPSLTAR